MGDNDSSALKQTLQEVWAELRAIASTAPPGVLGPPSLVAYEISSLEQRLAEISASCNPVEVEGCLADAKRLLHRYKVTSAALS